MNKKRAIGAINCQRKKMKIIRAIGQYRSRISCMYLNFKGKREKRTFEPSSGGIGTKLKIPKIILRNTIEAERERKATLSIPRLEEKRIINPKTIAIKKFESISILNI